MMSGTANTPKPPQVQAWTDSERAALEEHRARRPQRTEQELADADDLRSATRAIFELLHEHEGRLDVMTVHGHTVAKQIAELASGLQQMQKQMPDLMAQGFANAVSDPETWAKGRAAMQQAMQEAARNAAGGWVLKILGAVAGKVAWGLLILFVAYQTGGLPALLALFKLKAGGP